MTQQTGGELIERFFPSLIKINDLKLEMKNKEALVLMRECFDEFLGIPMDEVEAMGPDELKEKVGGQGTDRVERLMIGSHLLKERGDFYIYNGEKNKSEQQFYNSLLLFVQVYLEAPEFDFTRHFPILPELNNRVSREQISEEMIEAVNRIHDSIYE